MQEMTFNSLFLIADSRAAVTAFQRIKKILGEFVQLPASDAISIIFWSIWLAACFDEPVHDVAVATAEKWRRRCLKKMCCSGPDSRPIPCDHHILRATKHSVQHMDDVVWHNCHQFRSDQFEDTQSGYIFLLVLHSS